jgi:hypothetical protein
MNRENELEIRRLHEERKKQEEINAAHQNRIQSLEKMVEELTPQQNQTQVEDN